MVDRRNNTSARRPITRKADGDDRCKEDTMQVTFYLAPPQHITYFCMSYASGGPVRFRYESRICASEGNLAVIGLGHNRILLNEPSCAYFVYHAPTLSYESPELRWLPRPGIGVFPDEARCHGHPPHSEVDILRYHANGSDDTYKIATLCSHRQSGAKHYDIGVYDSGTDAWTRTPTAFPRPYDAPTKHPCSRFITVGGAMGWVDLYRGMLLCDVHLPGKEEGEKRPGPRLLRYVPLAEPMQRANSSHAT
ncbi:hypothetical protein ZWY2020_010051 [Hordeum vulgare]|nr:hypothetical protein ZWY2020_010051 [Hordeum vulgare]